jgi:hypothetical protein
MSTILSRPDVIIIAEVVDKMLRCTGHSREMLHQHLAKFGFEAYRVKLVSERWRKELELIPVSGSEEIPKYDAVFVRPGAPIYERVAPFVRKASIPGTDAS